MKLLVKAVALAFFSLTSVAAQDINLSLAYFMSPKHPMNAAVFTPFAESLAELSGGQMTVTQFPGGALNTAAPRQYSILLDGVADIAFVLPGYTSDLFRKTNLISLPGNCETAVECTQALQNAREELETEYNAKVLALWASHAPVLITRDRAVRSVADMQGMIVRVASKQDVPFIEALGASAVAQPVTAINQNLANGVIDAIVIDPSAIRSFSLHEPANFITTSFPGSGTAFALLMNRDAYDALSDVQKSWVDDAANAALSANGGAAYDRAGVSGLALAAEAGVEIITLTDAEKAGFADAVAATLEQVLTQTVGDKTVADVVSLMQGE